MVHNRSFISEKIIAVVSQVIPKSDVLGALASGLCLIHCVATPFLFIVQTCSVSGCCTGAPGWWSAIDYIFIGVTFFAVFHSTKHTSKSWMKTAMYSSWVVLTLLIINEKAAFLPIPEMFKYTAALGLIGLHLYNLKYCQCDEEGEACCAV